LNNDKSSGIIEFIMICLAAFVLMEIFVDHGVEVDRGRSEYALVIMTPSPHVHVFLQEIETGIMTGAVYLTDDMDGFTYWLLMSSGRKITLDWKDIRFRDGTVKRIFDSKQIYRELLGKDPDYYSVGKMVIV